MAAAQARRGRPPAIFQASWGERVPGLTRIGKTRWRSRSILGRDVVFTEPDERAAVARFKSMAAEAGVVLPSADLLATELLTGDMSSAERIAWAEEQRTRLVDERARLVAEAAVLQAQMSAVLAAHDLTSIGSGQLAIGSAGALWRWVANLLQSHPEEAAKGLGVRRSALKGLLAALPPTSAS